MFGKDPNCVKCGKDIKGDEVVLVKMRYPRCKGMTEIKAYLKNVCRMTRNRRISKRRIGLLLCRSISLRTANLRGS